MLQPAALLLWNLLNGHMAHVVITCWRCVRALQAVVAAQLEASAVQLVRKQSKRLDEQELELVRMKQQLKEAEAASYVTCDACWRCGGCIRVTLCA